MSDVWDMNWFGSTKTLDVHIGWLRRKLGDDPTAPSYIRTVRGVGFSLAARPGARGVSLRTLLLAAVTYVLLLAIVAFGVPLALSMSARVNAEVRTQARAQADLVAATAGDLLGRASRRELTTLAATASGSLRGRVLIVNAGGRVLADSAGSAEVGTSYLSRPEIRGALAGHQVQLQRTSRTLGQQILATAAPIIHNGRTAGAVRVTQSIAAVRQAVRNAELAIALIGATVLAIGLAAGTLLAGKIGRPLRRLEAVARRVAQGDLRARARSREAWSNARCRARSTR